VSSASTAMMRALLSDLVIVALWPGLISLFGALPIVTTAAAVAFADQIHPRFRSIAR
jgi:hypothetical protein